MICFNLFFFQKPHQTRPPLFVHGVCMAHGPARFIPFSYPTIQLSNNKTWMKKGTYASHLGTDGTPRCRTCMLCHRSRGGESLKWFCQADGMADVIGPSIQSLGLGQTNQQRSFCLCLSNAKRHKRRPQHPPVFYSSSSLNTHSLANHSPYPTPQSSVSLFFLFSFYLPSQHPLPAPPRPHNPHIFAMAQDSSDVAPNPSAASTAIQIDSTLNIIPPQPKVELQGFDKIREKLKPLLLYVVSFAQFLDIGTIHVLFFRSIRSFSTLSH